MKEKILLAAFLLSSCTIFAQKSSFIYAVSSPENQVNWVNIQMMNSRQGDLVQTVFDPSKQHAGITDVLTARQTGSWPTATSVAAAALDGSSLRMFFIPMRIPELRWADLRDPSSPKFFSLASPVLSSLNMNDPANHITRMVIAKDGYGYAATNDGNHLFRFSTGKKPDIVDLGNIVDASSNGAVSVHSQCSSWGGDMVAGTDGLLYLITQRKFVYSIDPATRMATHIGVITGLPENFTVNGAAADGEGRVLISCSTGNLPYYYVDLTSFKADVAFGTDKRINASDLASGNLASRAAVNNGQYVTGRSPFDHAVQKIGMYPNPVTERKFQLSFEGTEKGIHNIQVLDMSGKILLNKIINISGPGQFETVDLDKQLSKGMYFVKVLNSESKSVYTSKFVLQ
ncbi:MAG: T9SS type A sorting domain-containing protein [Chitinophagaceae bacterium]|nr:T9SS type A sorting domain-containing protein [Chitinophagaceae bacterium]